MKKKIIFLLLSFCMPTLANAEEAVEYLLPFPPGPINIVNGYQVDGGFETHQGSKAKYSIDFQYNIAPDKESEKYRDDFKKSPQCYSLGMPILATRAGKIIDRREPDEKKLNLDYGVMLRVGYEDGSYTWYGHMLENTLAVKMGEEVVAGQILGLMGATGFTVGHDCVWKNTINAQTSNKAPHLHMETNTSGQLAVLQEPMIGEKVYTEIRKAKGPYISATQMIDPTGHWAKFDALVPYEYTGSYVSMASRSAYKPRIQSFSPSVALAGSRQTFTIKGENLPKQLYVSMLGCAGLTWHKQEPEEQKFSCTLAKQPEPRAGFIRFSPEGEIVFNFKIETLSDIQKIPFPTIQTVEVEATRGGERADFKVVGQNLPGDLKLDLPDCTEFNYTKVTSSSVAFSCLLPHTVKDKNAKRVNGIHHFYTHLISESSNFSYPISFKADYFVHVKSMQPTTAEFNKELTLILRGSNLDLARAIWIEACGEMKVLEHKKDQIKVSCTPYKPEGRYDVLLPDWMESKLYQVLLKDEKGGDIIFEGGLTVTYVAINSPIPFPDQAPEHTQDPLNLPRANDDLIEYILKAKGNYGQEFLSKVEWKKELNQDKKYIYSPQNCPSELKGEPAQKNMKKGCLK